MKVGNIEGSPEEIHDFFENNGLQFSDYLSMPERQLKQRWLIIPSCVFVISFLLLSILHNVSETVKMTIFLIGFAAIIWLSVCIHIRFKNTWAAAILLTAGILLMLVALGVIPLSEVISHLKNINNA